MRLHAYGARAQRAALRCCAEFVGDLLARRATGELAGGPVEHDIGDALVRRGFVRARWARLAAVGIGVAEPEAPASVEQLLDLLDDVEIEQILPR